ncbi:hypothetical protein R4B61_01835 [Fructilactobacillus vespulae]
MKKNWDRLIGDEDYRHNVKMYTVKAGDHQIKDSLARLKTKDWSNY